jgi:hypothetical protein
MGGCGEERGEAKRQNPRYIEVRVWAKQLYLDRERREWKSFRSTIHKQIPDHHNTGRRPAIDESTEGKEDGRRSGGASRRTIRGGGARSPDGVEIARRAPEVGRGLWPLEVLAGARG